MSSPVEHRLPPGFTRHVSKSTNQVYFFNSETGERCWATDYDPATGTITKSEMRSSNVDAPPDKRGRIDEANTSVDMDLVEDDSDTEPPLTMSASVDASPFTAETVDEKITKFKADPETGAGVDELLAEVDLLMLEFLRRTVGS